MIEFDYACDKCGDFKTNHEMESFACECGGKYRLMSSNARGASTFVPHFSREIGQWVTSWKDAEEKGKKFRSEAHPNGFVLTQSNTKFMKEMAYLRKHREDWIQERYKKDGINYKPGQKNLRFDDNTRSFVPRG